MLSPMKLLVEFPRGVFLDQFYFEYIWPILVKPRNFFDLIIFAGDTSIIITDNNPEYLVSAKSNSLKYVFGYPLINSLAISENEIYGLYLAVAKRMSLFRSRKLCFG